MFQSTTVTIYSTLFRWLLVGSSLEWIVVLQRGQWLFGVLGTFSELHQHQNLTLCSSCSRQWLSSQFNTGKGHYWYVLQTESTSPEAYTLFFLQQAMAFLAIQYMQRTLLVHHSNWKHSHYPFLTLWIFNVSNWKHSHDPFLTLWIFNVFRVCIGQEFAAWSTTRNV